MANRFIESLENRCLFSTALIAGAHLRGGILTINGTTGNDVISVSVDPARTNSILVSLDGVSSDFKLRSVRKIVMNGGAGNDNLKINETYGSITLPATLSGGAGADTLTGGSGPGLLDGGDDNDMLIAGAGQQTLTGDAGDDTLFGGSAHDLLRGGDGNDSLVAGTGSNQLYGNAGNDTLIGGTGSDTLGGADEDALNFTGKPLMGVVSGRDSIVCGSGSDWVVGDDYDESRAPSTIVAGGGPDILDARTNLADVVVGRKAGDVVPSEDVYGQPETGQTQFATHTHAILNIYIEGKHVAIPYGAGEFGARGVFYSEAPPAGYHFPAGTLLHMKDIVVRPFILGEFFQNWGVSFDSTHIGQYIVGNGHKLTMTVNGKPVTSFNDYVMQSKSHLVNNVWVDDRIDRITIRYT